MRYEVHEIPRDGHRNPPDHGYLFGVYETLDEALERAREASREPSYYGPGLAAIQVCSEGGPGELYHIENGQVV